MFFLSQKDVSVGLDIGSHSIKLVKINRGKKIKILKAEKMRLPQDLVRGSFINENIRDKKVFAEKIKKLFQDANLNDKDISLGIPDISARSFFLELENIPADKEETKELIIWKLKKDIDSSLDKNFAIDFQILAKDSKGKKELENIFVAVINKKILAEYEDSLRQIGLRPVLINLSSLGLFNYLNFILQDTGNIFIINSGCQTTNFLILKDKKIDYLRSIDTGGRDFTSQIKEHFSVDWDEAEKKKIENTFFPESMDLSQLAGTNVMDNFGSIKSVQGNLVREISASLHHYESKSGGSKIEKIFLSGGTANFKNIDIFIKNVFNLEVINLKHIESAGLIQNVESNDMSVFAPAIGLLL